MYVCGEWTPTKKLYHFDQILEFWEANSVVIVTSFNVWACDSLLYLSLSLFLLFGFSCLRSFNRCRVYTRSNVAYRFKFISCASMYKCNCQELVQAPSQQYLKPFIFWRKVWLFNLWIINNLMQIYYASDNDNDDSCMHMGKWKYIRIYGEQMNWATKQPNQTKQNKKHSNQIAYTCSIMWRINNNTPSEIQVTIARDNHNQKTCIEVLVPTDSSGSLFSQSPIRIRQPSFLSINRLLCFDSFWHTSRFSPLSSITGFDSTQFPAKPNFFEINWTVFE